MVDLLALADRVERATEPDGELEAEIWLAVTDGATRNKWSYVHKATGRECWMDETRDKFGHLVLVPRYMESLDAAITLVPECRLWDVAMTPNGAAATVWDEGWTCPPERHQLTAATPALAITAACLRARASTDKGEA